jgi:hypothetical protein
MHGLLALRTSPINECEVSREYGNDDQEVNVLKRGISKEREAAERSHNSDAPSLSKNQAHEPFTGSTNCAGTGW